MTTRAMTMTIRTVTIILTTMDSILPPPQARRQRVTGKGRTMAAGDAELDKGKVVVLETE